MKVYRFTDQDKVLTASGNTKPPDSGGSGGEGGDNPTPNYAANALNEFMGGTNTTIE